MLERRLNISQDRYDLRRYIEFSAINDEASLWTIISNDGASTTCRYFLPATDILSIECDSPLPGSEQFKGESCIASRWPKNQVSFAGKRVAIVGTGSTGVQVSWLIWLEGEIHHERATSNAVWLNIIVHSQKLNERRGLYLQPLIIKTTQHPTTVGREKLIEPSDILPAS